MVQLKDKIIDLLTRLQADKRQLAILKFEARHPPKFSEAAVIEEMVFGSEDNERVRAPVGHISDKTFFVAMNYRQNMATIKREHIADVSIQIYKLEQKIGRLENCLNQLQQNQKDVLVGLYIDGKRIRDLAEEMGISESTIKRHRNKAVEMMTDMYQQLIDNGFDEGRLF